MRSIAHCVSPLTVFLQQWGRPVAFIPQLGPITRLGVVRRAASTLIFCFCTSAACAQEQAVAVYFEPVKAGGFFSKTSEYFAPLNKAIQEALS
jgi:hypothetical protein